MHKHKICARSTFFDAACSDRWSGSETRAIELPEDDPDIFDIYVNCVYNNVVDVGALEDRLAGEDRYYLENRHDARLVRSWVLSDKLRDVSASNMFIDALIELSEKVEKLPSKQVLSLALQSSIPSSAICQLFVDYWAYEVDPDAFTTDHSLIPIWFIFKVAEKKTQLCRDNLGARIEDVFFGRCVSKHLCRYHQHDENHPYCGTMCEKRSKDNTKDDADAPGSGSR